MDFSSGMQELSHSLQKLRLKPYFPTILNMNNSACNRDTWLGKETRVPGLLMFGHYRFQEAQAALPMHLHTDAIEICLLVRGEQTYRVGGEVYRLHGGDQFVTFPNEWHDTSEEPQKGDLYWIILDSRVPAGALQIERRLGVEMMRRLKELPVRHFRAASGAVKWLAQVERMLNEEKSDHGQLAGVCALHQYLLNTISAAAEAVHKQPGRQVQQAMNWMEAHLHEPARISEVAEAVGWSDAHLKAAFREETGETPHEYFLRRKIERARYLLSVEKQPVTSVAMALGFSSSQHFATAFRKFTRQTPSAVRAGRSTAKGSISARETRFTKVLEENTKRSGPRVRKV